MPLFIAIENCNPEIILLLLARPDLKINAKYILIYTIYYDKLISSDHFYFENGELHIIVKNCEFNMVEIILNRPDIKRAIFNFMHRVSLKSKSKSKKSKKSKKCLIE